MPFVFARESGLPQKSLLFGDGTRRAATFGGCKLGAGDLVLGFGLPQTRADLFIVDPEQ